LQIVFEQRSSMRLLQSCSRQGAYENTFDACAASAAGFRAVEDMLFAVDVRNLPLLLRSFDLPAVDPDLLVKLVGGNEVIRPEAVERFAYLRSGAPFRSHPLAAPFDNALVLPVALAGRMGAEIREFIVQNSRHNVAAVCAAIRSDSEQQVERMLDFGCPVDMVYEASARKSQLIHVAGDSPKVTKLLIERGASVSSRNNRGETPLHTATHPEVVQVLSAAGARIHEEDDDGKLALHHALEVAATTKRFESSADILEALFSAGADPFFVPAQASMDYLTPFQLAVKSGWLKHVQFIMDRFAVDLGQRSVFGKSLLQLANKDEAMKAFLRSAKAAATIEKSVEEGSGCIDSRRHSVQPL
jgi:hypothetical protein